MEDRRGAAGLLPKRIGLSAIGGDRFSPVSTPKSRKDWNSATRRRRTRMLNGLLESFAFLTGRIQYNIDREFPEIPAGMLSVLHPHLVAPIPSMDDRPLRRRSEAGERWSVDTPWRAIVSCWRPRAWARPCVFRTAYPVTLWPVELTDASLEPPERFDFLDRRPEAAATLRLRVNALGEAALDELGLDRLRFHLSWRPQQYLCAL